MEQRDGGSEKELLQRMKTIQKTVRRNFQDMVNLLTSVISLSSPHLGGHLRRVAEEGKGLADLLGLPKEESYSVYYAGLLHDIGLIGLSEEFLTRPEGPQTDEEQDAYRRHPVTGEEIINTVYDLRRIGILIRGHHEDYNGQGFPDGLKGEEIPLGSRILRIVSDYDDFLYLQGMSASKALDTLYSGGGQLYDPEILERYGSRVRPRDAFGSEEAKEVFVEDLKEGQFLMDDLFLKNGMLLMPRGLH